jgi:hypothetical protein
MGNALMQRPARSHSLQGARIAQQGSSRLACIGGGVGHSRQPDHICFFASRWRATPAALSICPYSGCVSDFCGFAPPIFPRRKQSGSRFKKGERGFSGYERSLWKGCSQEGTISISHEGWGSCQRVTACPQLLNNLEFGKVWELSAFSRHIWGR